MRGFTKMDEEKKVLPNMYIKRQGNALTIGHHKETHSAPISQILRIIKGKLKFLYVPLTKKRDKNIEKV